MNSEARGGEIRPSKSLGEPFLLSPGVAVVPDHFPPDLVDALNGGPTEVLTASEAMTLLDAEE